ncbi:hypothetical protein O0I10_010830 [Lichtheimia ornata]|uniref:Uncharacterized protein n=1 Tax=Lichtheimia ornata TaxID=688661 RepID=A0AAD7UU43_9FUNG|nr:uncharacterized protein O0I10_010830 [Lichtheimia ornata]KAJ8653502.1 hypothetical protein O0I10_010830 [Lichtheimia ornata]
MNSLFRIAPRVPVTAAAATRRFYATETAAASKPKVGAVRGGFVGFLLGVTVAGSVGYYYLLEEYNSASDSLLSSVQELQTSTEKVREYARKIEAVDKDVTKLKELAATTQQLNDLKAEFRKLYDTLNMEHLDLKSHVWGLEQDLNKAPQSSK